MSRTIAVLLLLAAGLCTAQPYPSKPVRLIVPVGPGGGLDFTARLVAPGLTETLGQPVVVDNRPGGSGTIGLELAARATPDGHTLVAIGMGQLGHAILYKANYDLFHDFASVSLITAAPYVAAVHPALPAKSMGELASYARANPGKLNYASTGNGTLQHLATELFAMTAGVKLVHVPYKGLGAAFPDLIAGRVHLVLSSAPSVVPHVRSNALRPLAVTSAKRAASLPDLPTMIEAGFAGFEVTQWQALLAPANTPRPVVERLHKDIVLALRRPDVVARLASDGTDGVGSSPKEFAARLRSEHEKWTKVIQAAGIRAETP